MRCTLLFFLFFLTFPILFAQTGNSDWMEYVEEMIEEGEDESFDMESLFEELSYLAEHPFNVRTLTKEELERLPFLTDKQIEEILYYIYRYGEILSLYELKNVEELDLRTVRWLLPFLYLGEVEDRSRTIEKDKLWKYGKKEILMRTNFTLQEKAGYRETTPEGLETTPNKHYLGEPYYLSFRGNYNYKDRILLGFAAEKDPGELFLKPKPQGFDHFAFNFSLVDFGWLDRLSLGDYQLSFGEGLVLNNHFSIGKNFMMNRNSQRRNPIKRHVSTGEVEFFRGVAATLCQEDWRATLFYSHRKQDANVEGERIKSWQTTGYHRIPNELNKKGAAEVDLGGFNLDYSRESFRLGLTAVYYSFGGKMLNPDARNYNLYYLRGEDHWNAGVYYSYRKRPWRLQGEIALDKASKLATINSLYLKASSYLDLQFSVRYYDKAYNALYARSFSESTMIQNESGFCAATKWIPKAYWEVNVYWDSFHFPYLKYGINAPSSGNDFQVHVQRTTSQESRLGVRYRYKRKRKNTKVNDETFVLPYSQHRWRVQFDYSLSPSIRSKTQAYYTIYEDTGARETGWSVAQTFSYSADKSPCSLDASLAWFDSPSWNTRIGVYECNVLYAYGFPTYYGIGLRGYLNLKWRIRDSLTLYLKLANSFYPDEETISSGLEEIAGNNKTDLYLLVKYKF